MTDGMQVVEMLHRTRYNGYAVYFAIWVSVYLTVKATSRQLNEKL